MRNLLILGGTAWLGAEVARQAEAAGIEVTCLARGTAGPPPPGARLVVADRARGGAYAQVADLEWDAVLDVSWQPGMVRQAVEALGDRAAHWTYVSSISAYAGEGAAGQRETAALHEPWPADVATIEEYGPAKAACEAYVRNALGERGLIARPGLIGGPGDPSDRFGYWPAAFARAGGGPVLVPADLDQPTQTIDVRDLASWLLGAMEAGACGPVNVVGASVPLGEVLRTAAEAAGATAHWRPADEAFLAAHDVAPWAGPRSLPLWLPQAEAPSFGQTPDARSLALGLSRRSLAETVADTLEDERVRGLDRARRAGLTRAEELSVLAEMS